MIHHYASTHLTLFRTNSDPSSRASWKNPVGKSVRILRSCFMLWNYGWIGGRIRSSCCILFRSIRVGMDLFWFDSFEDVCVNERVWKIGREVLVGSSYRVISSCSPLDYLNAFRHFICKISFIILFAAYNSEKFIHSFNIYNVTYTYLQDISEVSIVIIGWTKFEIDIKTNDKVILPFLKVNRISFIKTQNGFFPSPNGYLVYSYVREEMDVFRIYVSVSSISALRKSFAFVIW